MFKFQIGGVDMPTPGLGGFNLTFADLDGPASGRNALGYMRRDRKRVKMRQITVQYAALTTSQSKILLDALEPADLQITYIDPQLGETTKTMYVSDISLPIYAEVNGQTIWESMSFTLVEE